MNWTEIGLVVVAVANLVTTSTVLYYSRRIKALEERTQSESYEQLVVGDVVSVSVSRGPTGRTGTVEFNDRSHRLIKLPNA